MVKKNYKNGIIKLCSFFLFILICLQLVYLNLLENNKREQKYVPSMLKPRNINSKINGIFMSK